jgi:hypothetical protein
MIGEAIVYKYFCWMAKITDNRAFSGTFSIACILHSCQEYKVFSPLAYQQDKPPFFFPIIFKSYPK